eukprot:CAMPEP_0201527604 /NCGR_PEP_ID=MMETSP0161_2-20130828/35717_1 /ASSEMBLY_ACC=CAM_ASM_000251 /TAXON_ID=180227 /ORGANISM="Neoparamoeba aestuarina, Strain SoJaBio B1-5/56/2" /LENGTH=134 /DNA_ID=CAMNT_0047928507 /DNA_START=439 /DNA_END=844 /DNA_ORIENTATION=+
MTAYAVCEAEEEVTNRRTSFCWGGVTIIDRNSKHVPSHKKSVTVFHAKKTNKNISFFKSSVGRKEEGERGGKEEGGKENTGEGDKGRDSDWFVFEELAEIGEEEEEKEREDFSSTCKREDIEGEEEGEVNAGPL